MLGLYRILAFALLAGCGGGGSGGAPETPSKFLYAGVVGGPNTFQTYVWGFAVGPGGTLSPVPGSPAPTSDGGGPIAIARADGIRGTAPEENDDQVIEETDLNQ